ncbi:hypothetical protein SeMB42_g05185 [Synchytrium endobioticum]|uniref:Uncharacterized protein n=1 Tax=Synchytrium endobioticum TaxID=286115 RepID=A0A507CT82_9FUNG|nr:hypothetical protein SeMB42_g05185 [Synchytrium endobioticum]TPX47494.1 hypothetical protein SeLEV6574_g02625 [Synchytrium endobioticum]
MEYDGPWDAAIDAISKEWSRFLFDWRQFFNAVPLGSPLVIGLTSFQVILFIWILSCRSSQVWTISNFFLVGLLASGYQGLNQLGAAYYPGSEETRAYFDKHGIFLGVFYAGPLICQLVMVLLLLLGHVVGMLSRKASRRRQQRTIKKNE